MEVRKIVTMLSIVALNAPMAQPVLAAENITSNNSLEVSSSQAVIQKGEESSESNTQNLMENEVTNENVTDKVNQENDEQTGNPTLTTEDTKASEEIVTESQEKSDDSIKDTNTTTESAKQSAVTESSDNKKQVKTAKEAEVGTVTIKNVTDSGVVLRTKTITGSIGDSYSASSYGGESMFGWVVLDNPDNAKGTFQSEPQTVTYIYTSSPVRRLKVRYLDVNTQKEISESTYVTGHANAPYATKAKDLAGYTLVKDSGNTSGELNPMYTGSMDSIDVVTYYYEANKDAAPITVNYIDEDGSPLADSETLTGLIGQSYEGNVKNIAGWALKETPTNSKGVFSDKEQTVNYVYEKADAAPVTVKFVNADGKSVYDDVVLNGMVGSKYKAEPIIEESNSEGDSAISPKWLLKTTPENETGTFSDQPQTVTYVYSKPIDITVWYHVKRSDGSSAAISFGDQYFAEGSEYSIKLPTRFSQGWRIVGASDDIPLTGIATKNFSVAVYLEMYTPKVVEKYVDTEGNELASEEIIEGKYGYPYECAQKEIAGWKLKETPANAAGLLDEETKTVTYVYERATAAPVTVNYVDADGNELATSDTLNGSVGDAYETSPKTIAGWTLIETPANATGTFTDSEQTVNYVYEKATAAPVTVKYVDKDGNELAISDTLNGVLGDAYETSAKAIAGWTLTETPANATGTFTDSEQTVTYVYEKATAAPVTVKYVDKDGNELATPDALNGNVGDPYTTEAKTIAGWAVTETPSNATGTFGEESQTVTYVYKKATAAPVTVKYVDKDGNELATPDALNGNVGDPYTTEAKTIAGWTVTETPSNATGTFGEESQTVTYVYKKATAAPVTVKYVDKDGNELATPDTLSGNVGDPYTTEAKTIAGWTVTETPSNATGTFGKESQTVTYVYEKASILMSLKVKDSVINQGSTWKPADNFVSATDMDGEEIPFENVGVVGTVDTSKPGFYQVKYTINYENAEDKAAVLSLISSITGETAYAAEENDNSLSAIATIEVVSREDSLVVTNDNETTNKDLVQSFISKSKDGKYNLTDKTVKTLPKTGEQKQSVLIPTVGISVLLVSIYGFIMNRRKKKQ
ncbi:MucBP domain-containing protein [Enterococcus faecalis]|uniref:MucBP domain-containing protein n=1 Tax=Enterococcus faecalis TaxID=1351 RepID=UPI00287F60AA|nr:MucBP domain-containing protein [Enterococcus faecalis]